ncbi:MAG TPA: GntR family transcriptional regulator [Thermomicrobiaceae bacterium]|nr:GntR family transcriptional regulator [Thermomicrobiaceae bacterium]
MASTTQEPAAASKQELAYRTIRGRILDGRHGPGARVVIDEVARELGCSPIPVREAVRRLEAEGLVEYTRHAGARVVQIDGRRYVETLATLAVLEGYATAAAAPALGPDDLAELRRLGRAMRAAVASDDLQRYGTLNRAYHEAIYRRCDNGYLVEQIRAAWARLDSMRRSIFALLPERARASLDDHDRITGLLAEHAPAAEIEAAVRAHKLATARAFHDWAAREASRSDPSGAGPEISGGSD